MELSRREMLLAALGGATVLVGCGGGTEEPMVEPTVAILWRSANITRLEASSAARSARITLYNARAGKTATFLATRPDPVPETPVPYRFTEKIPDGECTLEVTFFTSVDGTGPVIATASGSVTVSQGGETTLATVQISDRVEGIILRSVPLNMKVGESFTPVLEAMASGPNQPVALSALPPASVFWESDNMLRQEENGKFVAVKAGKVPLRVRVVRADGTEKTAQFNIVVESEVQRQQLNMLLPLARPMYQGKIVGVSRFYNSLTLVDPATDARTRHPLPGPGMKLLTEPDGGDWVWLLDNNELSLWRMEIATGATAAVVAFPDSSTKVYPLGGSKVLASRYQSDTGYQFSHYSGDTRIGEPLTIATNVVLDVVPINDGSFYIWRTDENQLYRYATGPEGFTKLSQVAWTLPANIPASTMPFQYQSGKVLALDGTIRNAQTLEIEHQVTAPPGLGGSMCLSPSGNRILVSSWNSGLRFLVYEISTGHTLADLFFNHDPAELADAKPFFVDEDSIAYFQRDSVMVLRGVVSG